MINLFSVEIYWLISGLWMTYATSEGGAGGLDGDKKVVILSDQRRSKERLSLK